MSDLKHTALAIPPEEQVVCKFCTFKYTVSDDTGAGSMVCSPAHTASNTLPCEIMLTQNFIMLTQEEDWNAQACTEECL